MQRLFGEGLRRRQSAGGVENMRRTRLPSSMSKARESMFRTFFARVQALSAQWGNHTFHARWTLEHGEPEALAFLEQLAVAEVTPWRCPCGCASIDADAACGSGQPQAPYRRLHIVKRWHERRLPAILTVPCGPATVGRIRRLAAVDSTSRRNDLNRRQSNVSNGLIWWCMSARSSRFFIAGNIEEPVFVLDGIASEWLFVSGFWYRVNASLGTIYDQFEEDEAEPAALSQIACELAHQICELEGREEEMIRFIYRWTPQGETYTLEMQRADLISKLVEMRDFFNSAAASGEILELSL
ncbi:hypothetical protein [Burkholderia cepacia]|uniref:hypothetical protein n=2 Tax=Burkholderia cepacia TaxID=292 RepID=UPI00177C4C07|nr:hypothetical protein [Burkholderia cepacia]